MDTLLLGITVISLIVALVMSVTAWRLRRDEQRRSSARIAALSAAAGDDARFDAVEPTMPASSARPAAGRSPWKPAPFESPSPVHAGTDLSQRVDDPDISRTGVSPASGFLGASTVDTNTGNRQRGLAVATVVFFAAITTGFIVMMSGGGGAPAVAATGGGAPLELVSLSHSRQAGKLAVSGLVRNPVSGTPVEKLSAVVFLFDRAGAFVASSRTQVDFLRLGAGDETPFVVSIDAPASVARYRVSFRTDDGVVPHIDLRSATPAAGEGELPVNVSMK